MSKIVNNIDLKKVIECLEKHSDDDCSCGNDINSRICKSCRAGQKLNTLAEIGRDLYDEFLQGY